jgi:hypothetical protein
VRDERNDTRGQAPRAAVATECAKDRRGCVQAAAKASGGTEFLHDDRRAAPARGGPGTGCRDAGKNVASRCNRPSSGSSSGSHESDSDVIVSKRSRNHSRSATGGVPAGSRAKAAASPAAASIRSAGAALARTPSAESSVKFSHPHCLCRGGAKLELLPDDGHLGTPTSRVHLGVCVKLARVVHGQLCGRLSSHLGSHGVPLLRTRCFPHRGSPRPTLCHCRHQGPHSEHSGPILRRSSLHRGSPLLRSRRWNLLRAA